MAHNFRTKKMVVIFLPIWTANPVRTGGIPAEGGPLKPNRFFPVVLAVVAGMLPSGCGTHPTEDHADAQAGSFVTALIDGKPW
jgi:hypothetical protein